MDEKQKIIEVKNFSIEFGKARVIDNLNFDVYKGETFGLLGSNGSGKTTIIRTLLGIYSPSAGELLLNGKKFDVASGVSLGYLPEERGLYKKEKVLDIMCYFGELKGMSPSESKKWSLDFLKKVDLDGKEKLRLDKLSGGQQQKIQLGVTIMNDPDVLILDEPTKGFDPVNRRLLMDIIMEYKKRGATIIFITHNMDEVEKICDRILLLKDGKIAATGKVADVKKKYNGKSLDDIFVEIYGAIDYEKA